ncbi:LysM domain-containing protein [Colletotrichum gloeosporioides Cg-14]|uniref:LysM domain-containing protein n=1 Tax=Colletotrichum gloeosporioides (strain Cg-14) TaxID=1237896 RepID=T0JMS7_COLGC|nr:LysM domain-containing protein [Colletotrichum gloeosporioides Cg-14]
MTTSCNKFHKVASGDQCNVLATRANTARYGGKNSNRFYNVVSGDTCAIVSSKAGIFTTQFSAWNPQTGGAACSSLWLGHYVCTGVVGNASSPTTPTQGGNGVATPTPIQAGMVGNCKKFHFIKDSSPARPVPSSRRTTRSRPAAS